MSAKFFPRRSTASEGGARPTGTHHPGDPIAYESSATGDPAATSPATPLREIVRERVCAAPKAPEISLGSIKRQISDLLSRFPSQPDPQNPGRGRHGWSSLFRLRDGRLPFGAGRSDGSLWHRQSTWAPGASVMVESCSKAVNWDPARGVANPPDPSPAPTSSRRWVQARSSRSSFSVSPGWRLHPPILSQNVGSVASVRAPRVVPPGASSDLIAQSGVVPPNSQLPTYPKRATTFPFATHHHDDPLGQCPASDLLLDHRRPKSAIAVGLCAGLARPVKRIQALGLVGHPSSDVDPYDLQATMQWNPCQGAPTGPFDFTFSTLFQDPSTGQPSGSMPLQANGALGSSFIASKSAAASTFSAGLRPPNRTRVSNSCVRCKKRKVRCSREDPCAPSPPKSACNDTDNARHEHRFRLSEGRMRVFMGRGCCERHPRRRRRPSNLGPDRPAHRVPRERLGLDA